MPMPAYPIYCYTKGCKHLAVYKIAARWSDGVRSELKNYGLCCEECLPAWFRQSRQKQMQCRLTAGESLEPAGIYHMQHGERDKALPRMPEIEEKLRSGAGMGA
jgi:hypothetical protein